MLFCAYSFAIGAIDAAGIIEEAFSGFGLRDVRGLGVGHFRSGGEQLPARQASCGRGATASCR